MGIGPAAISTLNKPGEFVAPRYEEFYGQVSLMMEDLRAAKRNPISVADVLGRRLDVKKSSKTIREYWLENSFYTGDVIYANGCGDAKIVLDAHLLRKIDWKCRSEDCEEGLRLTDDQWDAATGNKVLMLPASRIGKINLKNFTRETIKDLQEWNFLAREHDKLVNYVDQFSSSKRKFLDEDRGNSMRFNFPSGEGGPMIMYALEIQSLWCGSVVETGALNYNESRLVGITKSKRK